MVKYSYYTYVCSLALLNVSERNNPMYRMLTPYLCMVSFNIFAEWTYGVLFSISWASLQTN